MSSCDEALKLYEQAKDRLEEYFNKPEDPSDRLDPGPGQREQEIERLQHAVVLAADAYERAKKEGHIAV